MPLDNQNLTKLTQEQVVVQKIQADDFAVLRSLIHSELGAKWTNEFLEWKYFQNPAGQVYGRCARVNDLKVGFIGHIPVRLKVGEILLTGTQAVDLVVDRQWRRRGFHILMAENSYEEMDRYDILLTYTFPNPISKAGLLQRLKWKSVGEVPRYVRFITPKKWAPQNKKGPFKHLLTDFVLSAFSAIFAIGLSKYVQFTGCVKKIDVFDQRFDRLWEKTSSEFVIAVERTSEYLNWRYVHNPLKQYVILAAENESEVVSYAVLSLRDVDQRASISLVEFLVSPQEEAAGLALLKECINFSSQMGCRYLNCFLLPQYPFYRRLLKQAGFIFLNNRFAPGIISYTTSFVIRQKPGVSLPIATDNIDNWFLTMGDHDYY